MAKILIEPDKARATLSQQEALEKTLRNLAQDVGSVRSGLRYKITGRERIDARLRDAVTQLTREADSTRAIRNGLEQVIGLYVQTEKGNLDRVAAEKTSIQQNAGSGAGSSEAEESGYKYVDFDFGKLIINELANLVGPFGFVFKGGEKIITKGDWGGAINEFVKSLGKGAKTLIDKPKADWAKNLFGLNMVKDAPNFWEKLGDFSTPGKAVGTAVSWATSFVDSLMKNTDEFGSDGWKTARFWDETFVETGTKIVEGALIATGVGAAAVAIFGSAPAIAIGAATALVTMGVDWGLNNLVSWMTDGAQTSWVEGFSDFVCDTKEKIVEGAGRVITKAVDGTKEVIKKGAEVVKDGFNTVVDAGKNFIGNLFSGCRWGKPCVAGGGW